MSIETPQKLKDTQGEVEPNDQAFIPWLGSNPMILFSSVFTWVLMSTVIFWIGNGIRDNWATNLIGAVAVIQVTGLGFDYKWRNKTKALVKHLILRIAVEATIAGIFLAVMSWLRA